MERNEMFQKISSDTGIGPEQIEQVYYSMVRAISEALCKGEEVVLIPEWGVFIPKEWDNVGLDDNSPRTRKPAHYKVRFRPGNKLQKSLVIAPDNVKLQCVKEIQKNT